MMPSSPPAAEPSAPTPGGARKFRPRNATLKSHSIYSALAGLPLLLHPRYKLDDMPVMSQESFSNPSMDVKFHFDFEKERTIIVAAKAKKQVQQRTAQEQQIRIQETNTILTPEPASTAAANSAQEPNRGSRTVDLTEFEHGLPPPDPWDVPRNFREELSDVLSPNTATNPAISGEAEPTRPLPVVAPKPQIPVQPSSQPAPAAHPIPAPRKKIGVPMVGLASSDNAPVSLPNKLISQGFGREGVAKAISLYGENELKVTSFANQYDRLIQCGFDAELVEISCAHYSEDNAEAVEFINNFMRLREYGFMDVQIKDGLIKHNNVLDTALNYILS